MFYRTQGLLAPAQKLELGKGRVYPDGVLDHYYYNNDVIYMFLKLHDKYGYHKKYKASISTK